MATETTSGVTDTLSRYAAGLKLADLPEPVIARTRLLILDLVGNIVRARHDAESTPPMLSAARALGFSAGNTSVLGDVRRYTPPGAAFLNGALGHSLDFDDTHAAGSLHPGAPVIPAALSAAEMVGAGGADVVAAIVAGYEVTCRTALALPAAEHYRRGFHPTATCGVFGAAAAAGRVFGLDASAIADALGIALSQSAGSLQFLANGAWTKRFQVGWAASSGLVAAALARESFRGAAEAIEGRYGFLHAYAPSPNPARAIEDLGGVFELMATAVKPYPSCRYGHAGIDAALALRSRHELRPERIDAVTLGLPNAGMQLIGDDIERRRNPQSTVDGQFSGPFVIACALATGGLGWDSYKLIDDPVIRSLMSKIDCVLAPEIEALFPARMAGKLTIRAGGETFTETVTIAKGEPENFLTEEELRGKFLNLAVPVLGMERASALADAVLTLDSASSVSALMRLAVPMGCVRLASD